MQVAFELVTAPTAEVEALVDELEIELSGDFAAHQRHGYSVARLFQPNIKFFVARIDAQTVGCGGIAFERDFAELKRMYVRPQNRGHGIGQAILNHLVSTARAGGITRVVLETGDVLQPAILMYGRAGFQHCSPFGDYLDMDPATIERSVFMEKWIGPEQS